MPCGRGKAVRSMRKRYGKIAGTRVFYATAHTRKDVTLHGKRRRR